MNGCHEILPQVLATDLDGTLIPDDLGAARALPLLSNLLSAHAMRLIFVTGRHLASVQRAIHEHELPLPDWIFCDVGTSIYQRLPDGGLQVSSEYQNQLQVISQSTTATQALDLLGTISGLTLQEPEKQGTYKLSFYGDATVIGDMQRELQLRLSHLQLPYSVVASIDPFTGDGLFDLLPLGVSKDFALQWWLNEQGMTPDHVLYAGDSGNDSAVFISGIRSIIVGNAANTLKNEIKQHHAGQGWDSRLYLAAETTTLGVLAGLRHFLQTPAVDGTARG